MKLSELVKLKQQLSALSVTDIGYNLDIVDGYVTNLLNIHLHADYIEDVNRLINKLDSIQNILNNFETVVNTIISKIDIEIAELTKEFHRRGYLINGELGSNKINLDAERSNRTLEIDDITKSHVINSIREHTDWHYPVLEIGPGDGVWTEHLVAGDPLYIVDIEPEYIQTTKNKFNQVYQNRIRTYLIGSWAGTSEFDLSILPANQFGFIFSWNVFNYFPAYETELMLTQCYELLRPGGTMIFSYNNCDLVQCAEYCEIGFRSWLTESLITSICKNIGFTISNHYNSVNNSFSWIKIRKPGNLKTVKAHQVLGKIVAHDP